MGSNTYLHVNMVRFDGNNGERKKNKILINKGWSDLIHGGNRNNCNNSIINSI